MLGHADFSKHNALFKRSQEEIGYRIVELAANHAQRISAAIDEHGQERVEQVLDAALALEAHVDTFKGVHRDLYPTHLAERKRSDDAFARRFRELPGEDNGLSIAVTTGAPKLYFEARIVSRNSSISVSITSTDPSFRTVYSNRFSSSASSRVR